MSKFKKKVLRKLDHIEELLVRLDIADAEVIGVTTFSGDGSESTDGISIGLDPKKEEK